jgi:hypothetical protein
MNFSAIIPIAHMDAANAVLDEAGHGPTNFSVPTRTPGSEGADYAGFHCWDVPAFRAAVEALPPEFGVIIMDGDGMPNFDKLCEREGKEWIQDWMPFDGDQSTLPMAGDKRMHDGKEWESLTDYNVWLPPVGWREVVAAGFPAWVQPTGSHDSYKVGDRVSFEGKNYESLISGNVWSPAVYAAGWRVIA